MKAGDMIAERYVLQEHLGIGGMSEVWVAEDTKLQRPVALKILHDQLLENSGLRDRFLKEAELTARLSHPNVVPVFDSGLLSNGRPFIAMEYASGSTLREYIDEGLSLDSIIQIFDQILSGVDAAHRAGIVHRDLKPDNIIIEEDGRVLILDFGVAMDMETFGEQTEAGTIIGTAKYLSPEQAHGETADERSDVYSVGIMLYEALTGKTPWESPSAISSLVQQSMEPAQPPSKINSEVPRNLDQITLRAIAYRSDLRFDSAEEFREALHSDLGKSAGGKRWLWLLAPLLALIAAGWWYIDGLRTVPDLTGKTVLEARQLLYKEDLGWFSRRSPSTKPPGTIILSSPAAGKSARKGDTVVLFVSLGPPESIVPNTTGLSQDEAEDLLEESGLLFETEAVPSDQPEGVVIGSDPEAGSAIAEGDTVTLQIASGVDKRTPNCQGLTEASCRTLLRERGWNAQTELQNSSEEPGVVIKQQTIGDATLLLYVSDGPQEIEVPDLRGLSLSNARMELAQSALGAIVQYRETIDVSQDDIVLRQSPSPGSSASGGGEVLLVVGRFSQ